MSNREAFQVYWQLLSADRKKFAFAVLNSSLFALSSEATILITGSMLIREMAERNTQQVITLSAIAIAGLCLRNIAYARASYVIRQIEIQGYERMSASISLALHRGMSQHHSASLAGAATRLLMAWSVFCVSSVMLLLPGVIHIIFGAIVVSTRAPIILLPFCLFALLYSLLIWRQIVKTRALASDAAHAANSMTMSLESMIAGRRMQWVLDRLACFVQASVNEASSMLTEHRQSVVRRLTNIRHLDLALYIVALGVAIWFCSNRSSSSADVLSVTYLLLAFAQTMSMQMQSIASAIVNISTSVGDAVPMSEQLALVPKERPVVPASDTEPRIEVSNLAKRDIIFADGCLRPGITVLAQRSGWGKSTFLRLLAGIELPDSGSVLYSGHPTHEYDVRSRVVLVEQSPPEISIKGEHLFADAPDRSFGMKFANADEQWLGRTLSEVSGGQGRRLYIAAGVTYLVDHTTIALLLDEPTNGLDNANVEILLTNLQRLADEFPNLIIVIASHDKRAMAIGTNIFA